jgi:hypothetical protein
MANLPGQQAATPTEKSVILCVHGVQAGFQVSLGLGGTTVALR